MESITLNNGIEMPALGLGVFQTPPDETRDAVRAALSSGYRLIDTAAAYGNERQVGDAVHDSHLSRSEVFLETKIWINDYGYDETLHGFEKSARKLGVDQIDLLIDPHRGEYRRFRLRAVGRRDHRDRPLGHRPARRP
jgi:diketogulonate reductase-like aldo/keto reductase